MKIMIIGAGYVGLVQGICLAELGNDVTCVDVDEEKIKKLQNGASPFFEPGIEEMIKMNLLARRIRFDSSVAKNINEAEIIFIAVGTPSDKDGRADLSQVLSAAKEIGKNIRKYKIIVNKSTVPIGTGELVKKTIAKYYKGKFDVVSNPEFLREGSAIDDFMQPDRIIIGDNNNKMAAKVVAKLYEVLNAPIVITNLETAEMIKYASNSYLASQISFINCVAKICEKVGANVAEVSKGMKLDSRIGPKAFLNAGLGYGGSCFPKDVQALIQIARDKKVDFKILEEVEATNKTQRQHFILKIKQELKNLKNKKITLWGAAFKPKTDDLRDAPSLTIIEALADLGAEITVYDPVAENNLKKIYPNINFASDPIEACKSADALIIVTEWDVFKQINLRDIKKVMDNPLIFDGRNIYDPEEMKDAGFKYISIGR